MSAAAPKSPSETLFVLRHAHSAMALPGQRDHDRPLDDRGRQDAPKVGAEIARQRYRIGTVLCSTAVRARQTLDAVRPFLAPDVAVLLSDELYDGGSEAYVAAVRDSAAAGGVMVVGHNPMIEEFTAALSGSGEPSALAVLQTGFPTAGLALIDLPGGFAELAPGAGHLRRLLHPRTLTA